ncbi:hypothetical protein MAR_006332 [Mya arenaria]|uniref:Integrin beta subunit cytoplasmic domain-containing protein n=1 Tax=Mya arenaria TaxID=6604 RepID=A0ABY7DB82_MYAAR|nr:hypothetical protein MAR_006332 [Mya arenaria]
MINETAIPLACQLSCPNLLVTMVNKFNDPDPCGFIVSKKCIINYLVECSNDTVRLNIANKRENEKQINETAIPLACQSSCPNLLVTMVNKFNDPDPCGFIESKECIRNYLVECSNDTVWLNIANQRVCTYPSDALLIVLPILACILGDLDFFYDKIEYPRFEYETQHGILNTEDNPIYGTPLTTNQNPVYNGGATD